MLLTTGMTIGKYELGKKLGQGGFGFVFVGRDISLDREVALKFLHPEHTANPEILRRFLQEARSAAKVVHPGIVTVFECGQVTGTGTAADGVAFIAMELLHGESLTDRLARSGQLQPDSAMEISRQVASALEAAHKAGIVHRDLKPDNIFLVADPAMPGGERTKVLDFGIAKLAQSHGSGVQTQSMMVFGTPRYMSPEQCRSAAHIDHRSDIYTLGCILYELVVGAPPFDGEVGELIAKHQMVAPSTARSIIGDLPEHLDELLNSMLAKEPGKRPQTMAAVQRALEARGSMAPGVAPTMLPDAGDSLPRFTPTPGSLGAKAAQAERLAKRAQSSQRAASGHAPTAAPASPTTLGGASGQWEAEDAPRKSKLPLALGAIAGLAILGAVIYVAAFRKSDADKPESPPIAAAGSGSASAVAPPPATPSDIELVITTVPPGAEVFTLDGRLLGETPFRYKRKVDEGSAVFSLRLQGHKDARAVMALDKSAEKNVVLEPLQVATVTRPGGETGSAAKPCDAEALREKGATAFEQRAFGPALASFEAAYKCKPDALYARRAAVAACNLKNTRKAREYWRRLAPGIRPEVLAACVRNGVTEDALEGKTARPPDPGTHNKKPTCNCKPCKPGELPDEVPC